MSIGFVIGAKDYRHYLIADLLGLEGVEAGFDNPIAMADGYGFIIGTKASKDSKICLWRRGVDPIADLHELEGFKAGFDNPIAMADGCGFIGIVVELFATI